MDAHTFNASHVATYGGARWPAMPTPDGTIVDLRLLDSSSVPMRLTWQPDELPAGISAESKRLAAQSDPPGFLIFRNDSSAVTA